MSAPRARRHPAASWARHWVFLAFAVVGLIAVLVVDADGDPTTTNVPSVVLSVEAPAPVDDDAHHTGTDPKSKVVATSSLLCRRVGEWSTRAQQRWHRRVRPIRGP
ncbi:MAG TPA: hypothetical protein VII76_04450 [Acidimicrobiales bacterium]